ncbi:MAG: serine hydrolase [Gammaproteobacteria bacterium]|nr:serine hydrolase [Gammaproteobacteria bacterium]
MNAETIILPGIGGSGNDHWQTLWKQRGMSGPVFEPSSWDTPDLDDWAAALERAVRSTKHPPLLIAHSLACLLVAHWGATTAATSLESSCSWMAVSHRCRSRSGREVLQALRASQSPASVRKLTALGARPASIIGGARLLAPTSRLLGRY